MKRNDYSEYTKGQEISGVTFQQHQDQVIESINSVMQSLGLDPAQMTVLWGVENCTIDPACSVSAGAVFYKGEIFEVAAYTGTAQTYPTGYCLKPVTNSVGDDIRFASDGSTKAVHLDYQYQIATGAPSVNPLDEEFAIGALQRIPEVLLDHTGAKEYTNGEVAALQTQIDQLRDAVAKIPEDNGTHHSTITRFYDAANLRVINTTNSVSDLGTYSKSKLQVSSGETRYLKYFCNLSMRREGSDNDRVRVRFEYSLNNGASWSPGKIYETLAGGELIPITIFDWLAVTSTPLYDIRFRLRYELLDLSIYVSKDDDIDFMIFQ